jgi:hypothetical protein
MRTVLTSSVHLQVVYLYGLEYTIALGEQAFFVASSRTAGAKAYKNNVGFLI